MDRRVTVLKRSTTVNDLNEPVESWASPFTVWGDVNYVSDAERLRNGTPLATNMIRVVIRSSSQSRAVTPMDRLSVEGREYEINGIKPVDRLNRIELTASARADV